MKYSFIVIITLAIYSCTSNSISNPEIKSPRKLYDDSANYITVNKNTYDSLGYLINEIVYYPYKRGIYLDTSINETMYKYDSEGNLIKALRVTSMRSDSNLTVYGYNENNKKIFKIRIKLPFDTIEYTSTSYYDSGYFKVTEILKLKKDPYARNPTNLPFDTSRVIILKKYVDSLQVVEKTFTKEANYTTLKGWLKFDYNSSNQIIKKTYFNAKGDSINWRVYDYENGHVKRTDFFINKGEVVTSSIYDSNGFLKWIINKKTLSNRTDTSFAECDTNGNVIVLKYNSSY
jgi:signal peptidase I